MDEYFNTNLSYIIERLDPVRQWLWEALEKETDTDTEKLEAAYNSFDEFMLKLKDLQK